ncbi:MAG: tetratricopeptide repeat protein [Thermodesulfobacteriota bacterium]
MRLSYALVWLLISFFVLRSAGAQEDFIQEYILSGKTIEVVFSAYGFTDSEWIGRCEPETASKLCGKRYTGKYNKELRTWEFSRLDENTGNVETSSSQALTKGDPVNYRMLIWDEEFSFDEKGNVVHSGDGKVAHISPGDLMPMAHRPERDEIGKTDIRKYRQEGIDFLQDYEYQKAIESFDKALEANPLDKILYFYRGYSYLRLEEYGKAVADLEKATILDQTNADAFSSLAAAYLELKKYEDVIRTATKAIVLNPKDAASYFNRGIAYNFTQKYDKAYSDFNEVVNLEPTNDDAMINRDLLLKKVQSK